MKQRLLFIALAFTALNAFAQKSYWKSVSGYDAIKLNKGKALFDFTFQPKAFSLFTLDEQSFRGIMANAPYNAMLNASQSSFIISIPVEKNRIERFRITESPVMQPKLQAKYSNIRSYIGKGIDNAASSVYFDISPAGFHAMILRADKPSVYINPIGNQLYVAFDHDQAGSDRKNLICQTKEDENSLIQNTGDAAKNADDGKLRTYRFAVESGAEFSNLFLNGTESSDAEKKGKVLAALVTDLVRINGIFETDFGVHLNYVDNQDTIIFFDKAKDPFISSAVKGYFLGQWNTQSQQTLDSYIGATNYDVGHLLMGFATGGNAGCIGCVCQNGSKGSGATGFTDNLTSDPFVVDFWAHEIGHQFGGNHTFDYSSEGTIAQMEPGSGSTIMGYAGTTGSTDIQPHSDPYFHAVSIQQVTDYVQGTNGNACAVVTNTGNAAPVANAGADYIIPKSTPFILTGNATDADASDVLTYCWEQFDNFNKTTSYKYPEATSLTGPIFRSYDPSVSKTRSFPALASIMDGSNGNEWEVLPGVSRNLNFRLTVRDNHPGGGANSSDDVNVGVTDAAGPFKITSPNTTVSIGEGSTQTITWEVANTNAAPVNCSNVKISLSLDGGLSFPYVLAASTPNDGSEDVTVPLIAASTTTARIKIEAIGNIFFDINDADFSIDGALPLQWLTLTAEKTGTRSALLKWSTANEINNNHFEIERSSDAVAFAKIATVAAGKNPNSVQEYTYTDSYIMTGLNYYRIKQVDNDGKFHYSPLVMVTADANGIKWSLRPNPATDKTTIIFNAGFTNVAININDASGKIVYKKLLATVNANQALDIAVNNFARGIYFVAITINGETRREKLVVE